GAADAIRALPRAPGRGAGDGPGGGAGAAGDRLSGRNDRPFLPVGVRAVGRRQYAGLMARFTRESVDRVKDAADIVEIISPYTDLQQRGQDYWGNCPFPEERTPSFKVNPRDKLYYCFGCEASGDVFRFVEEKEGLDFASAVESLAERFGVELQRESED